MHLVLLPCLFVALVHVYLWRRLIRDTQLAPAARRGGTLALLGLGLSIPAAYALRSFAARFWQAKVAVFAFGWLGMMLYLVGMLVAWDVLCAVRRFRARRSAGAASPQPSAAAHDRVGQVAARDGVDFGAPIAPTAPPQRALAAQPGDDLPREARRVFVARMVGSSALLASGGIAAFGVRAARWEITMPEVPVRLERLPKALDGYTIALLTDVHIGPLLDGRFLRQLAEQANRARPDLIAIGGDLVDGRVAQLAAQVAELRRLRARDGVCFVTGNHEYYSGAGAWVEFLRKLGLRVLMNQRVALGDAAASGAQFDLAGIPDHRAATTWNAIGPDARAATRGRDEERELVMLAHQPVQIADTAQVGAGLQLSGHTHGGQLYPFGAVALIPQPYLAGLHRHQPSGTQVYVSRGTGFWGPPMRVLAPAEISLIRLHSA
jgi:uncharacterized protein